MLKDMSESTKNMLCIAHSMFNSCQANLNLNDFYAKMEKQLLCRKIGAVDSLEVFILVFWYFYMYICTAMYLLKT